MTTEIVIMNKSAVVMAADSAGTYSTQGSKGDVKTKILNSVDKLFALSKSEPIGIMFYGQIDLAGVPWETVIKIFRRRQGKTQNKTVEEYYRKFIKYIDSFAVSTERLELYIRDVCEAVIGDRFLEVQSPETVGDSPESSDKEAASADYDYVKTAKDEMMSIHWKIFDAAIDKAIESSGVNFLSREARMSVREACLARIINNDIPFTGIVIAGFGEMEMFPSCYEFYVFTLDNGCQFISPVKKSKFRFLSLCRRFPYHNLISW